MQFALCSALALSVHKQGSLTKTIIAHRRAVRKMLLIMKLTALLLLVACIQVSAGGFAQPVTLFERNAPIEKVFAEIKKQTGYTFAYTDAMLKKAHPVTINMANGSVEQALEVCFKNQPLTYTIINKTVVVKAISHFNIDEPAEKPEPRADIRGFVTGDNNTPIPGANVTIKRTGRGTTTNGRGEFKFNDVEEDDMLIISVMGYESKEVAVKNYNKGLVVVQLKVSPDKLDEVQVRAYGQSTTRRLSTGSASRITAEDIQRQPVTNVLQALAGRVSGLSISQGSGLPGGDIFFQIRGQNSLKTPPGGVGKQGNEDLDPFLNAPLVVVDGIPYPSSPITYNTTTVQGVTQSLVGPNGTGSPLYFINPNDVESIDVLKDADATAIYGSRAANGVLLITTKKGKQGKTAFNANVNTGVSKVTRFIDMLNTQEYMALRRQAVINYGILPTNPLFEQVLYDLYNPIYPFDTTKSTDWQKDLIGQTAQTVSVNASVSGGGAGSSFLLSGNYSYQNGISPDRRGTGTGGLHFNFTHTAPNGKFYFGFSNVSNMSTIKLPSSAGLLPYTLTPHYKPIDSATGKLNWFLGNPYGSLLQTFLSRTIMTNNSLNLRYNILPGLNVATTVGYNLVQTDMNFQQPKNSTNSNLILERTSVTRAQTLNFEPQLQYDQQVAKGKLAVLIGGTMQKDINETPISVSAEGFPSDAYLGNISVGGTFNVRNGYGTYKYLSVYGRLNYNWEGKYLLSANFRRDGSSRFGTGHRFGNFGSIAGAWVFTKENFFPKSDVISFGKLRASYGVRGASDAGAFDFLSTYTPSGQSYGGVSGFYPSRLANSEYVWAENHSIDAALELAFFKDRILITANWFRNRSGNQLVQYPVSTQTGFPYYRSNLNALVENSGIELDLTTTNLQTKNFKWQTIFNVTIPRNKLISFPGIENTPYVNTYVVGKPVNSIFRLKYTGVDSVGLPTYLDANKDGKISYGYTDLEAYGKGDNVYIGKGYDDCYGGMTNSITFKGFRFDFSFQFRKGVLKQDILGSYSVQNNPGRINNVPKKVVEEIYARGLDKYFIYPDTSPKNSFLNYTSYSDATYTDASFIRLTNVALSWSAPQKWLQPVRMAAASIYMRAQNLGVWSHYQGLDPESGGINIPPLLSVQAGVQCSF